MARSTSAAELAAARPSSRPLDGSSRTSSSCSAGADQTPATSWPASGSSRSDAVVVVVTLLLPVTS